MVELTEADVRERFDEALKSAGSVRKLAAEIGVSYGLVGDVARGRREVCGKVAEFLGVEPIRVYREVK
jgi:hypothetical protein